MRGDTEERAPEGDVMSQEYYYRSYEMNGFPIPWKILNVFIDRFGELNRDFFLEFDLRGGQRTGYVLAMIWCSRACYYRGNDPDYWVVVGTWRIDESNIVYLRYEDEMTVHARLKKNIKVMDGASEGGCKARQ